MRIVTCEICNREIQVRSGMASETYTRHMKQHK